MTQPNPGQPDQPDPGQPDPAGQPDPNAQKQDPPKSTEEQLTELAAQIEEVKQHSRKWETRAKENKAKADEFDKLQAANATPDQKLQAAEEKAAKAERELARYKVAAETGVPAHLLNGDDEDAMRDHAKALIEFRGQQAPKNHSMKPDPTQGGTGDSGKRRSARDDGLAEARRRFGPKS